MEPFYIHQAVSLAKQHGAHNLNRELLCDHLGIPAGSFAHTMGVSYREFMDEVVEHLPLDLVRSGSVRMLPSLRKRQILAHAIDLSREHMYWGISAQQVADAAGISKANLARLYTLPELRQRVVEWAIEEQDEELLAQARTAKDKLLA